MKEIKESLRQLNIIYVVTTLFLVTLSMYTVSKILDLIDSSRLLTHTYEVKQTLQQILTTTVEAETNKRGFLLTGDSLLLQKKHLAVQSLTLQQALMDSLVQGDTEQVHNLAQLRRAIGEKIVNINNIPTEKKIFPLRYEMKINTLDGTQATDSVKHYITKMMMVEEQLLSQRTAQFSQRSFITPLLTVVLFLGAVCILLISYLRLQKELKYSIDLQNQLFFLYEEKTQRAAELIIANKELLYQNSEKEKRAAELEVINEELIAQGEEKEKQAIALLLVHKELIVQGEEKEKQATELLLVNKELIIQGNEKEKQATELAFVNKELLFQGSEKEKRAEELVIANEELLFQGSEKEKRAEELVIANEELLFQGNEKEKRAAELVIANKELLFQSSEKEKRAEELVIADKELVFQSAEKGKRAEELIIANKELQFQNKEKEKRAAELIIANKELLYQNREKEKRAAELIIANKELKFQNREKEKRAAELILANEELLFQSQEKEKRTVELLIVNKDLQLFTQISSHDLKEPLRKLQMAASRISGSDYDNLSDKGKRYFDSMRDAASTMQNLIDDLIAYSETNDKKGAFERTDLRTVIEEVKNGLQERIDEQHATIEIREICDADIIPFQFRQLLHNILGNALKFSRKDVPQHIVIQSTIEKGSTFQAALAGTTTMEKILPEESYCHISIADNGIGFEPEYNEKIFEVFQRLHSKEEYKGTGIGLAIVRRIVENHHGIITATGVLNAGARFDIYLPHQNA